MPNLLLVASDGLLTSVGSVTIGRQRLKPAAGERGRSDAGGAHPRLADPTVADSISDWLVHNAHRIEMRGDSVRKSRESQAPESDGPTQ